MCFFFSKYTLVGPLRQQVITITNAFQEILDSANNSIVKSEGCKPSKIWVDRGNEFDNRSMKSWLQDNDKEMYSTWNKRKSVVAERFIRTLKNKTYKYMT